MGLVFGTDHTLSDFLPPQKWDRGVLHKFDGRGMYGFLLKIFGKQVFKFKNISPVQLYHTNRYGDETQTEGIISYVLRNHHEFYKKGIKILLIDHQSWESKQIDSAFSNSAFSNSKVDSYDGHVFNSLPKMQINMKIVRQFRSKNFIAAYIPDYGAIVFNTVEGDLLSKSKGSFVHGADLKKRLNILILAIESASLAHLGHAKGQFAAKIIWRKERDLRKTADRLNKKQEQLKVQKKYLMAAGGVTEDQLNMNPLSISNGVYAFMDMVGSSVIREALNPREFFLVLNLCHEIAAENAGRFACRVDNFIGDSVFFQNVAVFDDPKQLCKPDPGERVMLMVCLLASVFNEIHLLKQGRHVLDRERRVVSFIKKHHVDIQFRAGLEQGTALIGPLGSSKRKIVTAIGKAVDTASRLECCGMGGKIHITQNMFNLLEAAVVSRDTGILRNIARGKKNSDWILTREYIPFFEFFEKLFNLDHGVFQKRTHVAYKEFSQENTYVIHCISQTSSPSVCPGI